jgi:UTP--glucose-1-phosphate uridylyltransferase
MKKNRKVSKAVITAGGFGTRFLPTTKTVPKEMIPVLEYPTIYYVVKELVDSGIEDILVVTRKSMPPTMEYFEPNVEVENFLKQGGKEDILEKVQFTNEVANFAFINQDTKLPKGTVAPVLSARQWIGDENFAIVYCDDLVLAKRPALKQLIEIFEKTMNVNWFFLVNELIGKKFTSMGF